MIAATRTHGIVPQCIWVHGWLPQRLVFPDPGMIALYLECYSTNYSREETPTTITIEMSRFQHALTPSKDMVRCEVHHRHFTRKSQRHGSWYHHSSRLSTRSFFMMLPAFGGRGRGRRIGVPETGPASAPCKPAGSPTQAFRKASLRIYAPGISATCLQTTRVRPSA
jgi:hypothetical protein